MADVVFHDLCVHVLDRRTKETKGILHHVSGEARQGRLLGIMGASGAGKSTLLDVLAGNTDVGSSGALQVEGAITVNGRPRRPKAFARLSCYVRQQDVLLASATVREAITTAALLKLPHSMSRADKQARVERVIKELDLQGCADTLIGDETIGIKGISGGQKRRVSIGVELVKEPVIIFLDEPTSGLDSEMASGCMETLKQLAQQGRTVVCTIHQPNSDITALFDDFMLLSAGHVVYGGPWTDAVGYFASFGHTCPSYKNPTDFFLSVVKNPQAAETMWTAHERQIKQQLPPSHDVLTTIVVDSGNAAAKEDANNDVQLAPVKLPESPTQDLTSAAGGTPWWCQARILTQRKLRDWVRNPNMLTSELLQYGVIGLFVGLMYFHSFSYDTVDGVMNRTACIWFAFAVMSFTPSFTTVTVWDGERKLLKREVSQKLYSIYTHYLSRTLVLIPFQAIQCLLFVAVMYFLAGFQANAAKFFTFCLALFLFQIISEGVGLLAAIITSTATFAVVLLTFVLLLLLSFSGFLVTKVPVYFRWVNKASYLTYAFAGLTRNEFEGLTLTAPDGSQVAGITAVPPSALNQFSTWGNIGILAAWAAGMELIKLIALEVAYRSGLL